MDALKFNLPPDVNFILVVVVAAVVEVPDLLLKIVVERNFHHL